MFDFLIKEKNYDVSVFEEIKSEAKEKEIFINKSEEKITVLIEKIDYVSGEYRDDLFLEFVTLEDGTVKLINKEIFYYENFFWSKWFHIGVPIIVISIISVSLFLF